MFSGLRQIANPAAWILAKVSMSPPSGPEVGKSASIQSVQLQVGLQEVGVGEPGEVTAVVVGVGGPGVGVLCVVAGVSEVVKTRVVLAAVVGPPV